MEFVYGKTVNNGDILKFNDMWGGDSFIVDCGDAIAFSNDDTPRPLRLKREQCKAFAVVLLRFAETGKIVENGLTPSFQNKPSKATQVGGRRKNGGAFFDYR